MTDIEISSSSAVGAAQYCLSPMEMSPTYIFVFESDFCDFANRREACEEFFLTFSAIIRHEFEMHVRIEAEIMPQRLEWMTSDFCTSAAGEDGIFLAALYASALERFRAEVADAQSRVDAIFGRAL